MENYWKVNDSLLKYLHLNLSDIWFSFWYFTDLSLKFQLTFLSLFGTNLFEWRRHSGLTKGEGRAGAVKFSVTSALFVFLNGSLQRWLDLKFEKVLVKFCPYYMYSSISILAIFLYSGVSLSSVCLYNKTLKK